MTELFYDESNSILRELRKGIAAHRGMPVYDQEIVQSIFRGVHTLKASSTMMLFENLAELSKSFEQLLYCFRGDGKEIADTKRFDDILISYVDFFEREIDKLSVGQQPDDNADVLEEKVKSFTEELKGEMEEDEMEEFQKHIDKPKRQIYYIAGVEENSAADVLKRAEKERQEIPVPDVPARHANEEFSFTMAEDSAEVKEDTISEKPSGANAGESGRFQKKYMLSEEKREMILQSTRNLQRIIDTLEYSVDDTGTTSVTQEQLEKLKEIAENLQQVKKYLKKTDFVPVAKKMEIVVDEMSVKLGKQVRLLVKGEHTPVDSEMREKISNALIHVIRNAVDHGIEDMDGRERLGKAPVGIIRLKFATEDGHLKIIVKDDGRGIDSEGILKNAQELGILKKPLSDYTSEEVYSLMLESGVTTTEIPNDYSGRGVGMDVIAHTVKEMGGRLKISSRLDEGTTVTMKF